VQRKSPPNTARAGGPGTLFIVSTPIGNLEDITHRAVRVLREAAVVACEDTRVTRVLLAHYGIVARTVAYHERNRERAAPGLLARLASGESIALATDAGTPGISDPAAHLVALAAERGIPVVPVPGPSALLAALVASGLPTARFLFEGFLPKSGSARRERLERLAAEPRTIVLFEAAPRVAATLRELERALGPRRAVLAREITKLFEEFRRAPLSELVLGVATDPPRGEIVLVVEGASPAAASAVRPGGASDPALEDAFAAAVEEARRLVRDGRRPTAAVAESARSHRLPRRELYRRFVAPSGAPALPRRDDPPGSA